MSQSTITELWPWQLIWVRKSQWFENLAAETEFIAKKFICRKISFIKDEIKA